MIRLLATIGIISSSGMRQYRKIAAVALLCFAAIITPPDIISQCLIFVPCYVLYEYGIGIAERIEKRRAHEEAIYQAKVAAEKAKAEQEAAEKEAAEKAEAERKAAEKADKPAEEKAEESKDSDDNEPTPEEPTEEPVAEAETADEAEPAEEKPAEEKVAEKSAPKRGEQTDEMPDNPNPGDYDVMDEHEVSFGVSESTDEELEIMRRFMPKSDE